MANEFLKMKWRKLFETHNHNDDDVLSIEDSEVFSINFAKYYKLNATEAQKVRDKVHHYYKSWILQGHHRINEETFLRELEKSYVADKQKFRENARRAFTSIVEVVDKNGDGYISEDEFEIMAKCTNFKHYNSNYMKAFPQEKKGFISLEVYLNSFVEFVCNDDINNIEVEKPRHFGMGIIVKNE